MWGVQQVLLYVSAQREVATGAFWAEKGAECLVVKCIDMTNKRIEKGNNVVVSGKKLVKSDEKGQKIVENRYLRVINMLLLK